MKLDLDRQPMGRSALELAGEVDLGLGEDRPGPTSLKGELTVQNLDARCLVTGTLEAEGKAQCGRCLSSFACRWSVAVDLMVLRDVDSDEEEGETLLIQQKDGEVDLDDALRECAVLAFPHAPVCSQDCQGLCPVCGIDRNEGQCNCEEEDYDPRWEGLP